jgi:hypothetical protein
MQGEPVEWLLGYDARESRVAADDLWPFGRRERFLLAVDAVRPLSTDTAVWPSVFDHGQGIGLADAERTRLGFAGLPPPPYTGPNGGLWEDLAALRTCLREHLPELPPCAIVAVSLVAYRKSGGAGGPGPYAIRPLAGVHTAGWQLLGFDVADGSLLSGLSNCGYEPEEARSLRGEWARHLTEHHLFADAGRAAAFRELADLRVPEHAPFSVYGLYLVEEAVEEGTFWQARRLAGG